MKNANPGSCERPHVSVIIATRDRAADLARCLPTVLANDYPCFDVIVVDQGSGVPGHLPASERLRYYRQATKGKARALNAACRLTDAPILLFTDDDCTVDPDWISTAVALFDGEPGVDAIYGALQGIPHNRSHVHIPEFEPNVPRVLAGRWSRIRRTRGVGANLALRREAWVAASGFDEAFSPGGPYGTGEDTELCYRLLRIGRRCLETPEWRAAHWGIRQFENGEARELVVRSYRAFGALYGRNLRKGDPLAFFAFAMQLGIEVRTMLDDAIHRRRPTGARRILGLLSGARRGFMEARRLPRQGAAVELVPVGDPATAQARVTARVGAAPPPPASCAGCPPSSGRGRHPD